MAPLLTWLAAQQFIQVINQFLRFIAVIIKSIVFLIIHFVIFFFEVCFFSKIVKVVILKLLEIVKVILVLDLGLLNRLSYGRLALCCNRLCFLAFALCRNRFFLVQIDSIFIIQVIQFQIAVV